MLKLVGAEKQDVHMHLPILLADLLESPASLVTQLGSISAMPNQLTACSNTDEHEY